MRYSCRACGHTWTARKRNASQRRCSKCHSRRVEPITAPGNTAPSAPVAEECPASSYRADPVTEPAQDLAGVTVPPYGITATRAPGITTPGRTRGPYAPPLRPGITVPTTGPGKTIPGGAPRPVLPRLPRLPRWAQAVIGFTVGALLVVGGVALYNANTRPANTR